MTGVIVSMVLGACEATADGPANYPEGTIAAILAADERFDTFMEITEQDMPRVALDSITAPELDITLFAPTDDAFAALPAGALDWLRNDDNVRDLQLLYDHHVLREAHTLGDLRSNVEGGNGEVQALESAIRLTLADGVLQVDGASLIDGDIEAVNGVIHVIDAVMIPNSVSIP
jgi:transforming growth factor-beta-induced protein